MHTSMDECHIVFNNLARKQDYVINPASLTDYLFDKCWFII